MTGATMIPPGLHASTYLGVPAFQNWGDMMMWERVFNEHPYMKSVVELGTCDGGMSTYFLLQARQRGMAFHTFDIGRSPMIDAGVAKELGLAEHFTRCDIFEGSQVQELLSRDDMHPLLLYCDNGNKPREFATFVPYLRPGDIVATHDWGTEFQEKDIVPVAALVRPIHQEECDKSGSVTRFFRVVEPGESGKSWGRIAIGVRVGKYPEPGFFVDWTAFINSGLRPRDKILLPRCHMPAHWAGDAVVRDFLRTDLDTLLMVDDDMTFPPDTLSRLRDNEPNWGYDVVGAFYTFRVWPPKPLTYKLMEQPPEPLSFRGDWFNPQLGVKEGQVVPVDAVGFGFTLIRREVLEAMVNTDYGTEWTYMFKSLSREGVFREMVGKPDLRLEFTSFLDYGEGKESDDIPFSRRVREHGFRLAVDCGVRIGHIGHMPLGWDDMKRWIASRDKVNVDGADLAPMLRAAIPHLEGAQKAQAEEMLHAIE